MADLKGILEIIFQYGGWPILLILLVYVAVFPDRAEKFSSLVWKCLRGVYRGAEKKYIVHDIQGRVNDYVNNYLSKEINGFNQVNIKLEWVNEAEDENSFRNNGKIIVRMRKSDNQNKNFVNASMVFIAESVLPKAKRYISSRQRESIDLFIGKKLFETEKEAVLVQFVDDFLKLGNDDDKVGIFLEKYNNIDKSGLFFPIFIQEMIFLGEKVFAASYSKDEITNDVNELIDFLNKYAQRSMGEKVALDFRGKHSKFGIIIVGDNLKVSQQGIYPYMTVTEASFREGMETVYLIGNSRREDFIKDVCSDDFLSKHGLSVVNNKKYKNFVRNRDSKPIKVETFLVAVRKNDVEHYLSAS